MTNKTHLLKQSETKAEMTFDFDGLIQLLAGHLYSEKKVFIRELIQNSHDAIQRRAVRDKDFDLSAGRIDILTDLTDQPGRVVFRDNGLGMTRLDLETYLSTIGRSGTLAAQGETPDVIGQFGIGFLSGFVVGSRVEVRTRHWQAAQDESCLWENDGSKDYTIKPCDREQAIGTEVIVHLRGAEDRGLLHDDAVRKVIREYADMLRVSIYLNDPQHTGSPANLSQMPWERTGVSDNEMRLDCMIYLEKTVPDNVLEVIRIDESGDVHAQGLLYITRTRVIGTDAPRTIRVFQKRMFLCQDAKELLPQWATFVNGIINTPDLSPNAARDNFTRNDQFLRLRDRLGDVIVAHFEKLKEKEPQRLSEILAYHDLAIKAACHYYDPFFEKFAHLLEWRINAKSSAADQKTWRGGRFVAEETGGNYAWATLPDILAALPVTKEGAPKRLACFTTSSSANQYFEMADAAGTTVVDASYYFEGELLKSYMEKKKSEVGLVYVDREDDPAVFRDIDPEADRTVRALAQRMAEIIRPGGTGRLRVEARRFEPATLPAVLKDSEAGRGISKARSILNDPNSTADLRTMAEEMLRLRRNADMRMTINAANPLIRTLATLDFDDPHVVDLLLGVYNDAILYNQELMTPNNAKVFHEQFQRLLARSTEFVQQKTEIARAQAELASQRAKSRTQTTRQHLVAFLMTPFADAFAPTREGIRILVEDKLGCELRTADKKTFEDFIRGNVHAHLDDADFFIADVSGANPNVMLELGAALYGRRGEPALLVVRTDGNAAKPELPVGLEGHLAGRYSADDMAADIAKKLENEFSKHQQLKTLLERYGREKYVSPTAIQGFSRGLLSNQLLCQRLSERYPTPSAWRTARIEDIKCVLDNDADLADVLLSRVHSGLE